MWSTSAALRQLFARRAIDGKAEEVTWLADISVPVAVPKEVDERYEVQQEHREQDDAECSLIPSCPTRSILLCLYGSFEVLVVAGLNTVCRIVLRRQVSLIECATFSIHLPKTRRRAHLLWLVAKCNQPSQQEPPRWKVESYQTMLSLERAGSVDDCCCRSHRPARH